MNYGQQSPVCSLAFMNHVNCDIEISEVQFCQTNGDETIDSCNINGIVANSVLKVQNNTFKGYPIYKASFEKAAKFTPQTCGTLAVRLTTKNNPYNYGGRQIAVITGDSINHSFTVNGKPITLALQGYNNINSWSCLIAMKMRFVK